MSLTKRAGFVVLLCAAGGACGGQVVLPGASSTISPGPGPGSSPGSTASGGGGTATSASGGGGGSTQADAGCDPSAPPPVLDGGTLGTLSFAITGSTRPASQDDLSAYPTMVIQRIWQDVEATAPRPGFAVLTGNYIFANPTGTGAAPQLDLYLAARAAFSNPVFPAMGDQECNGATNGACLPGNTSNDYAAFMAKMIAPLGICTPYYEVDVASTGNAWNAKVVVIAANAWDATQATWLDAAMAKPTTYTFVVRHEGASQTTAPGVAPSEAILASHPYTLLFDGAERTFAYDPTTREVTVGNGGAPLEGSTDYGYAIAAQRADGAITVEALDYQTSAVVQTFAVTPDGTPTP